MGFLFGGGGRQAVQQPAMSGISIQTSVYGKCIPIVYGTNRIADNVMWYGDFQVQGSGSGGGGKSGGGGGGKGGVVGGGGGKGGSGSSGYNYFASFQMALCEGPITGVGAVYVNQNRYASPATLGLTVFDGTYTQAAWSYLISNHPTQADTYHGLSYVAASNYALGNSAVLPNHNFEIQGLFCTSVAGQPDADPSLVVNSLLTDANFGIGFPSNRIGSLTTFQNYTLATGLLISPAYVTQMQSSAMIDDIAACCNSAVVWSNGAMQFIPYGDVSATGNGKTYTPPSSPIYDLTDDDFMDQKQHGASSGSTDAVILSRSRQSDAYNSLKMEFCDNTNNYNVAVVEVDDQASIDVYGLRQSSTTSAHLFTSYAVAYLSAQLQLYRQMIRNVYQFTLDQRYILLDPMDIVTLTDSKLGLSKQWVRILTITENNDYSLTFTAEEYLQGTGSPATNNFQTNSGYTTNYNVSAGNANAPIIFDAPVQIATNGGLETWMAVCGGTNWGGCQVWISSDNVTYDYAGTFTGASRMGVLLAGLPLGTDPDLTHTLSVNLTESAGVLLSGTQADADLFHTLCYCDGELISYETATLTAASEYNLSYLRRGVYDTAIAAHASGSTFARLDNQIFVLPYTKDKIGSVVYVKLLSFNIYGGGLQALSAVSPYTHTISGPNPPSDVTGFGVKQNGNVVVFAWNDITDYALKGYDIGYAPVGSTLWSQYDLLTEASKATEMSNANVPPGTWLFAIRARDIADQLSPDINPITFTVTNQNPILTVQEQAPNFPGPVTGFLRHWTGVLVPDDKNTAASYVGSSNFMMFCPTPVSSCIYTTPNYNIGYTANFRIFETNAEVLGGDQSGSSNVNPTTSADFYAQGSTDPGVYVPWTIGSADFGNVSMKLTYNPVQNSVAVVSEFSFTVDTVPMVETSPTTVTISSGGTTITFPEAFHTVPFVSPVVQSSGTALYATVSQVTLSGALVNIWSSAGVSVGGTITYTATGS